MIKSIFARAARKFSEKRNAIMTFESLQLMPQLLKNVQKSGY